MRNKLELSKVSIGELQISRYICTLEWIMNPCRKMVKAGECVFDPLGTAVPNLILSTKNGENDCVVDRIVKRRLSNTNVYFSRQLDLAAR